MADTSTTIREQVRTLLAARPDVTQEEFGRAVGRGFSWVSAFLAGTRHANDVRLVVRIARYFGVTVGYLLKESDRERDAGAMTLLTTWESLPHADRDVVLQLALSLRRRADDGGDEGSSGGSNGTATRRGATRTPTERLKPRARKYREH
jgi:transcriptional regulator with XRE-family HTH domain